MNWDANILSKILMNEETGKCIERARWHEGRRVYVAARASFNVEHPSTWFTSGQCSRTRDTSGPSRLERKRCSDLYLKMGLSVQKKKKKMHRIHPKKAARSKNWVGKVSRHKLPKWWLWTPAMSNQKPNTGKKCHGPQHRAKGTLGCPTKDAQALRPGNYKTSGWKWRVLLNVCNAYGFALWIYEDSIWAHQSSPAGLGVRCHPKPHSLSFL